MLTGNFVWCALRTHADKHTGSSPWSNYFRVLAEIRAAFPASCEPSGRNMQTMHQTTQECRLQGTSAHLTRFCSRKRPFVALSQTQCCIARDPRRASSGSRPSVSRSAHEQQVGPLRAATLGTAEAASDSIEAINVRPEALSQSDQRQRFDWDNQWYAIGYERWASLELKTNLIVMDCQ